MLAIMNAICTSRIVKLTALDACSEMHGRQNFIEIRALFAKLAEFAPQNAVIIAAHKEVRHTIDFFMDITYLVYAVVAVCYNSC